MNDLRSGLIAELQGLEKRAQLIRDFLKNYGELARDSWAALEDTPVQQVFPIQKPTFDRATYRAAYKKLHRARQGIALAIEKGLTKPMDVSKEPANVVLELWNKLLCAQGKRNKTCDVAAVVALLGEKSRIGSAEVKKNNNCVEGKKKPHLSSSKTAAELKADAARRNKAYRNSPKGKAHEQARNARRRQQYLDRKGAERQQQIAGLSHVLSFDKSTKVA